MIHVYGIKNCDSVKKALKFFKEHNIAINFTDFRENPVEDSQVASWADQVDMKVLFNNRSRTYKDLGLASENLDDSKKLTWLQKEPLLIKRPVVEYNGEVIVGFKQADYEGRFL